MRGQLGYKILGMHNFAWYIIHRILSIPDLRLDAGTSYLCRICH